MRVIALILAVLIPNVAFAFNPEKGEANLGQLVESRDARALADAVRLRRLERGFAVAKTDAGVEIPQTTLRHPGPATAVRDASGEAFHGDDVALPFGIDVRNREPVASFVRFWTGRGRPTFVRVLARMGRYEPMIRTILREEGVPEDLIYLCFIESGFATRALSPANARGLWQFIPATGIAYGLRIDGAVDERLDPEKATRAAARYLKSLRHKTGSWPLAMAGYNAGSGHVLRAMSKGNSNSYFTLARRDVLYENTRKYVAKILAAAFVARNRDRFGIDAVQSEPELTWDVVEVPGGTMLKDVAVAAGTDTATLRALNPALIHAVTPTRVSVHSLRIPSGSADQFVAAFDELGSGPHYTYVTRVGETLEMAARRLDVPARVLRSVNGLPTTARVPYRTKLLVPAESIPDAGLSPGDDLLPWLSTREATRRERVQITALVPETRFVYADRGQWFYRTRKGDTLRELGTKLGVEPADIAMWNALDADAPILGGFVLQLFLPQGAEEGALVFHPDQTDIVYEGTDSWAQAYATVHRRRPAGTASRGGRTYRVRAGDTIGSIAKRTGVSPDEIRRWNNIRGRRLRPGYRLVLYGGKGRAKDGKASGGSSPRAGSRRTARKGRRKKGAKGVNKGRKPPRRATRRAGRTAHVRYRRH